MEMIEDAGTCVHARDPVAPFPPTRLLVVDDEETVRLALGDALRLQGYQVLTATSGEEALELLRSQHFDLLLTDQVMPGLSGIELAETMIRIHPELPIVLLTGDTHVELAQASLQRGASDFVTKPINIWELPILIERNLMRRHLEAARWKEREGQVLFEAIKALASAVDAKDPYTARHSVEVTRLSLFLADAIGLPGDDKHLLELAAWMHDVGKIGVPDQLLAKPAALTVEEYEAVKLHPVRGGEIVGQIAELVSVADAIRHHHERLDGLGYPDRLRGEAIPLASRIILIADAYEAMTSDRSYRPSLGQARALEELRRENGKQFDPDLVGVFISIAEVLPTT
jgi:cyclic di-GMP phosphodiesterase